jgi:hypothetical protein
VPHPKFTKSSAEMVARFDELAELAPRATRRQMFGYPSLVLNGNMFMSLFGDSLVLRLDEAGRQDLVESHHGEPFEPNLAARATRPSAPRVVGQVRTRAAACMSLNSKGVFGCLTADSRVCRVSLRSNPAGDRPTGTA